jgi:hypothetical protein
MTMVPFWLLPGGMGREKKQKMRRFVGYDFSLACRVSRTLNVGAEYSTYQLEMIHRFTCPFETVSKVWKTEDQDWKLKNAIR